MLSASRLADTYMMASKAKSKLTKEAAKPEYDLRILVSHANFLDNLMDDLAKHRQNQKSAAISSANKVRFADESVRSDRTAKDRAVNYTEDEYNYNYGYNGSYEDSDSDLDDNDDDYVLEVSSSESEDEEDDANANDDDQADIIDEFYEVTFLHKYHDNALPTIKEEASKSMGADAFSYDNIKVTSNAVEEDEEETGQKGILTVVA